MNDSLPTPRTTLAIILGASCFPRYPDYHASPAFRNSAEALRDYFLDEKSFALPTQNLRYLFDAHESPPDLVWQIRDFLDRRTEELKEEGNPARDIIVYYVGHGDFANPTNDYFLAIRSTNRADPFLSSLPIVSLARALKDKTRHIRRYIILDSCFSAAAHKIFQGSHPLQIAAMKTEDAFPSRGTALLCSSGPRDPSVSPPGLPLTMFSGALMDVLRQGDASMADRLSLQDVAALIRGRIRKQFEDKGVRPELHTPDQSEGEVDLVGLFPSIIQRSTPASSSRTTSASTQRHEEADRDAEIEREREVDREKLRLAEEEKRRAEEARRNAALERERNVERERVRLAEEEKKRAAVAERKAAMERDLPPSQRRLRLTEQRRQRDEDARRKIVLEYKDQGEKDKPR